MTRERLYLFDTTLRDGAQTNGVDFTLTDKFAIMRMLDELGIDYVEGGYPGAYPFVGSPDDIAREMARMSATGLAGCTVAFVDYLKEIPFFVQEVLPRLERLGLREKA